MPDDLKPHSLYTNKDIVKWVAAQLGAASDTGAILPAWMIGAFEDAMKRKKEVEPTEFAVHREYLENTTVKMDDLFKFELVYFKTEDTVFSVIKDWLTVEDSPFPTMFALPAGDSTPAVLEGTRTTNPILLEQTSAASFRAFLRLLYGPRGDHLQTYNEWVGALELAMRWNFTQVRKQAIAGLHSLLPSLDPPTRIRLARKFSVGPWLRAGLIALVEAVSEKNLTRTALTGFISNDCDPEYALDMATVANVFYACFELATLKGGSNTFCEGCLKSGWNPAGCPSCKVVRDSKAREKIVEDIFGAEIGGCIYAKEEL